MAEHTPALADYDIVIANISGGKDSQAMLDLLVERAREQEVVERIVAVHADLGRVEWAGTKEIAEHHAESYGVRFVSVARPQGDLLAHIEERGMFPSASARYCTSDHKRGQVAKVITSLVAEKRDSGELGDPPRQARVLSVMGIRADESTARSRKPALDEDEHASSSRRLVQTWLPILSWSEREVWERIRRSGVAYHHAYDLNMRRLSCCFCVLSSRRDLEIAARHNPELAQEYRQLEQKTGHTIKADLSMEQIIAAANGAGEPLYEQQALFDEPCVDAADIPERST